MKFLGLAQRDKTLIVATVDGVIELVLGDPVPVCGWRRDELVGQTLHDRLIPHEYRDEHLEGLADYRKTGKGPALGHTFGTTAMGPDGIEHKVWLTVFGANPVTGRMYGLLETRVT